MGSASDLVLGTMLFGTRVDEPTSFALLDRFVAAGGTSLDTANCYAFWASPTGAGGQSEAVIGRWLAANPGVRDRLVIATKVGQEPSGDAVEGLSAEVIARACKLSRERLGLDTIDLYWAHGEDRSVDPAETVAALGALVSGGAVGRLGVSNHPAWRVQQARALAEAAGVASYDAMQLSASYVSPRPGAAVPGKDHRFGFLSDEQVDLAATTAMELWSYSPLIQGAFDRSDRAFPEAYDHPGTTRRLATLAQIADEHDVRPGQVVLAWLLAGWPDGGRPPIRPIVGVSSLEQLDEALAAATLELSGEERARLESPA